MILASIKPRTALLGLYYRYPENNHSYTSALSPRKDEVFSSETHGSYAIPRTQVFARSFQALREKPRSRTAKSVARAGLGVLVHLQAAHAVVDAGLDDRHVERVSDLDQVAGSSGFRLRNVGKFTKFASMICQTLDGSFSAVSKPTFATKYSLECSCRDLHYALN